MHAAEDINRTSRPPLAWLLDLPPRSERTIRMEALIARMRLVVLAVNSAALLFFLDTSGMHMPWVWTLVGAACLYAIPIVVLQPYRRWRVFHTSMASTVLDSLFIAVFIGASGGGASPFFPLYYLSAAAIAMRFDLRQAIIGCLLYTFTYSVAYFVTWDQSMNALGELMVRNADVLFVAVGVGHRAREENSRSREVEVIERLNAENARLMSNKEKAARIDKLTGLLNRASLEKDALKEVRRAKAAGSYLSVLFCDMDRLKRINDELGHDAGDRVLRQVGVALKRALRTQDLIGRYGGDEFVVVLPNLTRETAFDRADALVAAITSLNESLPDDLDIGLSVGIATYPFDAADYPTLVKVADQAMYLAKNAGGSRVRTANDLRLFWEEVPRAS
jgi:diguanylate cyclase (GGDEF)-like protein